MPSSLTPTGIAHDRDGPRRPHPGRAAARRHRRPTDVGPAVGRGLTACGMPCASTCAASGSRTARPLGALDPVGDVLGDPRPPRHHDVPPRGVVVRGRRGRRGRPDPPGCVRSLLLAPPGGSLFTERTSAFAAFAAAENDAMARGDLDAAVEANVDAWVVGEGRTGADVDPDVTAAVRVMQRRAFDIDAAWADPDLDEVELGPAGHRALRGGRPAGAARRRSVTTSTSCGWPRTASRPACRTCAASTVPTPPTCRRWRSRSGFLRLLLDWVTEQD